MIAIHHREKSFSDHWIKYCIDHNVPYKIINAGSNDIIKELEGCKAFLWNWVYFENVDIKNAKYLTYLIEKTGVKVFPNLNTGLFFDDKIGQKYLFEIYKIPAIPTYVFYTKKEALAWVEKNNFPKVFKLKGGSSSDNVWLVKSKRKARKIVGRMFSRGIKTERKSSIIKDRIWEVHRDKSFASFKRLLTGLLRYVFPKDYLKYMEIQRGYVYFQDFIPNLTYDIRIVVIGKKAFGAKRIVRKGDFRASGSGMLKYGQNEVEKEYFDMAFSINKKLKFQSIAFDFVKSENKIQLIEISYTFPSWLFDNIQGYYTEDGKWHEEKLNPANLIIEELLKN